MAPYLTICLFILLAGMAVGSFLNVCICRLPRGESVVTPPSHCPACDYRIRWYDNIPLLSYLLLRGRCRGCGTRISLQYPLVELLNGLLTLALFLRFGPTLAFLVLFLFCSALVVITFIDIEHQIIPDEIAGPGILAGYIVSLTMSDHAAVPLAIGIVGGGASLFLAFGTLLLPWRTAAVPDEGADDAFDVGQYKRFLLASLPGIVLGAYAAIAFDGQVWATSLLGIFAGADLICLVIVAWYLVRKEEGMGGGDIKLLAMLGAFLGWKAIPFIIFAGSLVGSVVGVTIMLVQKKDSKLAIPFGPYLVFGAVLYIFYGRQIIQWYLAIGAPAAG